MAATWRPIASRTVEGALVVTCVLSTPIVAVLGRFSINQTHQGLEPLGVRFSFTVGLLMTAGGKDLPN